MYVCLIFFNINIIKISSKSRRGGNAEWGIIFSRGAFAPRRPGSKWTWRVKLIFFWRGICIDAGPFGSLVSWWQEAFAVSSCNDAGLNGFGWWFKKYIVVVRQLLLQKSKVIIRIPSTTDEAGCYCYSRCQFIAAQWFAVSLISVLFCWWSFSAFHISGFARVVSMVVMIQISWGDAAVHSGEVGQGGATCGGKHCCCCHLKEVFNQCANFLFSLRDNRA